MDDILIVLIYTLIFLNVSYTLYHLVGMLLLKLFPNLYEFLLKKRLDLFDFLSVIWMLFVEFIIRAYGYLDRKSERSKKRKETLKWLRHWKKAELANLDKSRHRSSDINAMLDASNSGAIDLFDEPSGLPVNIICFDGGGVRGLTILEIMKELEKTVKGSFWDKFDLAAGTSIGGVAAFLANKFPEKGEATKNAEMMIRSIVDGSFSKTRVSTLLAEGELCEDNRAEVFKYGFGENEPLRNDRPLKAFAVTSVEKESIEEGEPEVHPFLMRTYDKPEKNPDAPLIEGTSFIKMWEAAEATSAAPLLWKRTQVIVPEGDGDNEKTKKLELCDGFLVANDPTELAIYEAKALFPGRPIGLVLSIGCGHANEKDVDTALHSVCRPDIREMIEVMDGDYVRLDPFIGDVHWIEARDYALSDLRKKVKKYMSESYEVFRAHRILRRQTKMNRPSPTMHMHVSNGSSASLGDSFSSSGSRDWARARRPAKEPHQLEIPQMIETEESSTSLGSFTNPDPPDSKNWDKPMASLNISSERSIPSILKVFERFQMDKSARSQNVPIRSKCSRRGSNQSTVYGSI